MGSHMEQIMNKEIHLNHVTKANLIEGCIKMLSTKKWP